MEIQDKDAGFQVPVRRITLSYKAERLLSIRKRLELIGFSPLVQCDSKQLNIGRIVVNDHDIRNNHVFLISYALWVRLGGIGWVCGPPVGLSCWTMEPSLKNSSKFDGL